VSLAVNTVLSAAPVRDEPADVFTRSALCQDGEVLSEDGFRRWWRSRLGRPGFEVTRIPFD
jgi:hypothetical protein